MSTINSQLLTTATPIAQAQNSAGAQVDRIAMGDITCVVAGANQSNIAFTADASTDVCTTATDHGFTTGVKVTFTTTGVLPAGLALVTAYYLTVLSSTTFKVSSSQANVTAGTYVNITGAGTGVHTVAVATTLAGTAKLQKNNNPPDVTAVWVDLVNAEVLTGTASQTISAAGTLNWALATIGARELRVNIAITSGTVTADVRIHGKSQN